MRGSSVKQALSRPSDRQAPEVLRWRLERLIDAGYNPATAASLAERVEIDLHLAVRLVRNGCPPAIAVRILV
jgi:hypothetical protein